MCRFLCLLAILALALAASGCSGDRDPTIHENTQDLAAEGVLDFDEVHQKMADMELPDLMRVPKEQIGNNRTDLDPIAYLNSRADETKEYVYIGFYLTGEDAEPVIEKRRADLQEGLTEELWDMTISERICNIYFLYYPGQELFRPQLITKGQELYLKLYEDCYGPSAAEKERKRLEARNKKLVANGTEFPEEEEATSEPA